ncbi:uncharacterized protein EAE98_000814 [Botrytis deweyae]|uniref:Uncharacterized protein n=1 Tax=Botrytis deweyae TaxID=2478750 RepID=A0ABQ7IZQ0_9HELO|nr:uncharacterized protein EAE98_000814 [Botrytis deweyae]KAF7938476.1 hypothetical protein EAE98_000814 [Botrytis deweyae]
MYSHFLLYIHICTFLIAGAEQEQRPTQRRNASDAPPATHPQRRTPSDAPPATQRQRRTPSDAPPSAATSSRTSSRTTPPRTAHKPQTQTTPHPAARHAPAQTRQRQRCNPQAQAGKPKLAKLSEAGPSKPQHAPASQTQ